MAALRRVVRALAIAALALATGSAGAAAALLLAQAAALCTRPSLPARIEPPPAAAGPVPRDLDPGAAYAPAALWLLWAGILRGDPDGQLRPAAALTRAELAAALARASGQLDPGGPAAPRRTRWADDHLIPAWARPALALAEQGGWFPGARERIEPDRPVTWREVAAAALAVTENRGAGPDPVLAAGRLGLWDALRAQGLDPVPERQVTRGELAVALLAAALLPRAYDPGLGAFRLREGLLAAHRPAVYEAFRQVHPDAGCR